MKADKRRAKVGDMVRHLRNGRIGKITYIFEDNSGAMMVEDGKGVFVTYPTSCELVEEEPVIEKTPDKLVTRYKNGATAIQTRESIRIIPPHENDHISANAILSDVLEKFVSQTEKGVRKYGKTVDPNDYSTIQWIDHAIEESIDHIVYLTTLKRKIAEANRSSE